jgi:hypothetical protein
MTKAIKGPKTGKKRTGSKSSFRREVFPERIKKRLIRDRKK